MSKKDDFKVFEKFVDEKSDFESVKSKITPKELGSVKPAQCLNKRKLALVTTLASVLVVAIILSVIFIPFGFKPDQTANTSVNIGDNSVISANLGDNSTTSAGDTDSSSVGGGTIDPLFPNDQTKVNLSNRASDELNHRYADVEVLLSVEFFESEYEGKEELIRLCELSAEDEEVYQEQVDALVGEMMEEEKEWLEGLGLTVSKNDDTSFIVSGSSDALTNLYNGKYNYYISMGDERTAPEVDIEALRGWYVAEEIVCRKGTKKDGYFENDFKLPFYFEVKNDAIIDDRSKNIVPKIFMSLKMTDKYNSVDLQNLINYKAKTYFVLVEEGSNSFNVGLYINSYGTYATVYASGCTFKVRKVEEREVVFPEVEGDELLPQVDTYELYGKYRVPEVIFANYLNDISVKEDGKILQNELEFMIGRNFTIEEEPVDRSRENYYGFTEYISIYGGEEMQKLMHSAYRKFVVYRENGKRYVFIYVSTQGLFVSNTNMDANISNLGQTSVYKAEYLGSPEDFPEPEERTGKKGEFVRLWPFDWRDDYIGLFTTYEDFLGSLSDENNADTFIIMGGVCDEEFFEEWALFAITYTVGSAGYSIVDVNVSAKGNILNVMITQLPPEGAAADVITVKGFCLAVDRKLLDGVEKINVYFTDGVDISLWKYAAGINDHVYTYDRT